MTADVGTAVFATAWISQQVHPFYPLSIFEQARRMSRKPRRTRIEMSHARYFHASTKYPVIKETQHSLGGFSLSWRAPRNFDYAVQRALRSTWDCSVHTNRCASALLQTRREFNPLVDHPLLSQDKTGCARHVSVSSSWTWPFLSWLSHSYLD